jgi:hypothetical protein
MAKNAQSGLDLAKRVFQVHGGVYKARVEA